MPGGRLAFFKKKVPEASYMDSLSGMGLQSNRFEEFKNQNLFLNPLAQSSQNYPKKSKSVTRVSVAQHGEVEFVGTRKKVRTQKMSKPLLNVEFKPRFNTNIIEKVLILLLLGLSMRLVFMDRGMIDYLKAENRISGVESKIKLSKNENQALREEIQLLKNNKAYQKRITRDHLGVISSDEYLVLFAGS